ncbi:MAG: glycosyltransferase [Candidatus Roizmanbacteria bacterium]|nr:glycosyltransferase [Candidatus Roizmanbacteria bacterium]
MRALFLTPYLDSLGGGEKYLLDIARAYHDAGYYTALLWPDPYIKKRLIARFGAPYGFIDINSQWHTRNAVSKAQFLAQSDVFFYQPDGSYPFSLAKKNVALLQVPNRELLGNDSWFSSIKSSRYIPLYNSRFVKRYFDKHSHHLSLGQVLYPIVSDNYFIDVPQTHKEKMILSVGRFFKHLHAKKQEVLIRAFQYGLEKYPQLFNDYRLVLAGGCKPEDEPYVDSLRKLIHDDARITLHINASYDELMQQYAQAQFYWHAAGYGVSEKESPMSVEHFGIAIVEAMASGAVPIAYEAGGPKETIMHEKTGYLFSKRQELAHYTARLIQNPAQYAIMQQAGQTRAKEHFSYTALQQRLQTLNLI